MIGAAYCSKELCEMLSRKGIEARFSMKFEKGGAWYKRYTLDIASRWLREVHGLHITIYYSSHLYGGKPFYWDINKMTNESRMKTLLDTSTATGDYTYKTYELALEAAIRYCVENLI